MCRPAVGGRGPPRQQPERNPLFVKVCGVSVVILLALFDVSRACGYKYQCVMFDIYDPTSGCILPSSQRETQLRNTIRHLKTLIVPLCFSFSTDVSTAHRPATKWTWRRSLVQSPDTLFLFDLIYFKQSVSTFEGAQCKRGSASSGMETPQGVARGVPVGAVTWTESNRVTYWPN